MKSDHVEGGFDLKLDVSKWAKETSPQWTFAITPRANAIASKCGTAIRVTELHDEVHRRVSDGVFEGQLREAIAKTYAYYMTKFVNITLCGTKVEPINFDIGSNHTSEKFDHDGVTCVITAGIGIPQSGGFRDRSSGWFIFCNGRAVLSADKTPMTGWGTGLLPLFQPKHRPFIGTVFFVSSDAEQLPWNTTKSGINEDSVLWQLAKRHMSSVGRAVISFLDGRYTDEGTEVPTKELQAAAGSRVNVMAAAVSQKRTFEPPKTPTPVNTRIQYDAAIDDIKSITKYLKRPSMSGSEVGRHTFFHFLRNEVGEK